MTVDSADLRPAFGRRGHAPDMTTCAKNIASRLRGRFARLVVLAGVLTTLAGPVALPSAVRADEPVRSGTILSGTGETPVSFWVRGAEGCVSTPACTAWLQSGCSPALASPDPAAQAAIVDIEEVVDTNPDRVLEVRAGIGVNLGDFLVQFWTGSGPVGTWNFCAEIFEGRKTSWECRRAGFVDRTCTLQIPYWAKWMTITSSPDNTDLDWTLT